MKFAICNETFQEWPLEKGFAFAAKCGYTGIEIAPFTISESVTDISQEQRKEICRLAEAAGLEIIGIHWLLAKTEGLYVTSPDPEVRRKTADYMAELVRFCSDIGGSVMVFGSPQQRDILPGVSRGEAMEYAAEVFRAILPVLEETGIVVALEPLGPDETNFLVTTDDAIELAEMIGSSQVRLHLDCKAMATEPIPIAETVRKYHAMLAHFHANDANLQGPGFGDVDFLPILESLGEVGYDGWVSVEVFDYSPGVERLATESIDYMKQCLAKLAS